MPPGTAMASHIPAEPRVLSVGPSWWALAACAAVLGAMLPWLLSKGPVELAIPGVAVWTLPEGMPLWIAISALFFAFLFSLRTRVIVEPNTRTITRWRCVGGFIPWSVKTRAFEEVRFVRTSTHLSLWQHIVNPFLEVLAGDPANDRNATIPTAGSLDVQIVFQDRDWFIAARGDQERLIAIAQMLCDIIGTRRG